MTKLNLNRNVAYSIFATIAALALVMSTVEGSMSSNAALAVTAETIPGPVFPPTPEFTATEMQSFMAKSMSVPGIKAWSDKWQIGYTDFSGTTSPVPRWEQMILHLYLPPNVSAPNACDIGWESIVVFDLTTRQIVHSFSPDISTACHRGVVKLGDPSENEKIETGIFPAAEAAPLHNGYAVATQEDVLNTSNSIQGSIADILTPAFNGQYNHMDQYVGQLVNLRFSSTPGVNYAQSGWVIAKSGCTTSCGDLVLPNSKVLVWADSSVSPSNSDAHVFGYPTPQTWVNGQTETAEVLCNGGTNYKIQAAYGTNLYQHSTNIACTQKAQGNEIANSVFFENANAAAFNTWPSDITSTVRATNTSEKLNGSWAQWQNSKDKDQTCIPTIRDPSTVMTGNVKLGGTATWSTLSNMPPGC